MAVTKTQPKAVDPGIAEEHRKYLRQMLLIRRFEEKAGEAYSLGKIGGFCHLYIGQEAVGVGCMASLRNDDYITCSYREHGQALARGVSARSVMAELFGKAAGSSKGKGGSMHIFDAGLGFLGGHGIVGGHIPLTTGMAFAAKYTNTDQVAICFFGEAAVNQGAFHEALNMAALWKLPAIYICENNRYGMGTALERASAIYDISERACSYDMANEVVDGQDVLAVKAAPVDAGPLEANRDFSLKARLAGQGQRQTVLLWAALIAAVVILAILTLRLARREPSGSAQG